jgi:hypothetical protein
VGRHSGETRPAMRNKVGGVVIFCLLKLIFDA